MATAATLAMYLFACHSITAFYYCFSGRKAALPQPTRSDEVSDQPRTNEPDVQDLLSIAPLMLLEDTGVCPWDVTAHYQSAAVLVHAYKVRDASHY